MSSSICQVHWGGRGIQHAPDILGMQVLQEGRQDLRLPVQRLNAFLPSFQPTFIKASSNTAMAQTYARNPSAGSSLGVGSALNASKV